MDLYRPESAQIREGLDMDVGTVQSPAVNVTMPGQKAGTPVPAAESKPLAPMGTCIGANGPRFCCGRPRHSHRADVRHPYPSHPSVYSRVRNAERSMFIPPKFSLTT